MSANGWSVATNTAIGALLVAGFGVAVIVGLGMVVNADRGSREPRLRWELILAGFMALVLLLAPAIGFLSYRSLVWDCENGTRNSQCRPEDNVTRNDVNVDLNVDGPS